MLANDTTPPRTLGALSRQAPPRSLWYERIARDAGAQGAHDWLIEEANLRGFYGAYVASPSRSQPASGLCNEAIIVGLLAPQVEADARTLKLVLRMLQSGRIDNAKLRWWMRKERSHCALYWLWSLVPPSEMNDALRALAPLFVHPPRGYQGNAFVYDPSRLKRRPLTREALCKTPRS